MLTGEKILQYIVVFILLFLFFIISSNIHYALFHTAVEFFCIFTAFSIFIIGWNTRIISKNNYLVFLGIPHFFVGIILLFHTFSYKGINLFSGFDSNLPTQLWIASRIVLSISFFCAPLVMKRKLNFNFIFFCYFFVTAIMLALCFMRIFPDCFIESAGLTQFKKTAEILSVVLFGLSSVLLYRKKSDFSPQLFVLLQIITGSYMCAGLFFVFYIHVYDFSNFLGHIMVFTAAYLLFHVMLDMGIYRPYRLIIESKDKLDISQKRYQLLFNGCNDAVFVFELLDDGNVSSLTEVNEKLGLFLGYSVDELMQMNIYDIFEQTIISDIKMILERSNDNKGFLQETIMHKKNGESVPVELSSRHIKIFDKDFVMNIVRDITDRKNNESEKEKLINALKESLEKVKLLSGFLPICACCKKIRDDKGYWRQVEDYIRKHSEAEFSHSICPECLKKHYPEMFEKIPNEESDSEP